MKLHEQLFRFLSVGLITNGIALALFYLVNRNFELPPEFLILLFYFGGLILNLVLNNRFTFARSFSPTMSVLLRSGLMYGGGAFLNYFIMKIGVGFYQLDPIFCFFVAVVVMPIYFFTTARLFVYGSKR